MDQGERLADRGKMAIAHKPISELLPYAKNARTHSDAQVAQIASSMREWGWTNPVLIDEHGMIIAGHGRILAARKLKLADDIPCVVLEGLTDIQKQALVIADNKIAMNSGWDDDLLLMELGELNDAGVDLGLVGFDEGELAALLGGTAPGEGLTDPDDVPSAPVVPVSVLGDVWILGSHRLICGDSTDLNAVEKVLNGVKPHLMVTDPPYGVNYDPNWRSSLDKVHRATGKVQNDDVADWQDSYALFSGDVAYVWHAPQGASIVQKGLENCGFKLRSQIIWVKPHFVLSRGDYHGQHEPCQPAGTMISKVVKEGRWREHSVIEQVPIETLEVGDKVVSFNGTKIFRRGRKITEIGSRLYSGNLHEVRVAGLSTKTTAEHRFTIRFDPAHAKTCILYLMRRGSRWRIGVCGLFNSRGFGLAVRLDQERGEDAWIISAHSSMRAARVAEQAATCLYGIPTTHWETLRQAATPWNNRDHNEIEEIYRLVGCDWIESGVSRLMAARGLKRDLPLITNGEGGRFSRSQSRTVQACNIIPGIMQIPVPTTLEGYEWRGIEANTFDPVENLRVWSMNVDQDKHYIADGIVTHNCFYMVKKSATGHWAGDRKQTTVWQITNGTFQGGKAKAEDAKTGHGTQKPVECMRRPIENNSSPGQAVYEPFSGSGSSIIACEMTGRSCHAVELNPQYVDVAIQRWQNFTGREAVLESTGKTYAETAGERASPN